MIAETTPSSSSSSSMKIGFSFKTNSSSSSQQPSRKREAPIDDGDRDYVTEITGNRLTSMIPEKKSGPLVIPLDVQALTKRSKVTSADQPSAPVQPVAQTNEPPKEKTLEEMAIEAIINEAKDIKEPVKNERVILPITMQHQIEGIEGITDEEERFKYDLASRPDEADEDAYENVPIEEFGFAMLRGMGWEEGKPIGLNNRGLTQPIEYVKRPGFRLGLGATPKDVEIKKKKIIKPGESREPAPVMVAQPGPDGKIRHIRGLDEKLVPLKKGFAPGQLVAIVSGPHDGLYARIVQTQGEEVVVRLQASEEEVEVAVSDITIVDASKLSENHPALKLMKKSIHEEEENGKHKKSSEHKSSTTTTSRDEDDGSPSWLRPRIMVRMISKSFGKGKYYNKKVNIYDVVGHKLCTVQLDDGSLVEGVKQRMLETVIPKSGGKVMVVAGQHKGMLGTLLERKKSGSKEDALVQLFQDLSINSYSLDDIAQYTGSHDDESMDM